MLGRGANAFIANDVRANVTQQSEGRKLCFQQALFLTSSHYAVGVTEIIDSETHQVFPNLRISETLYEIGRTLVRHRHTVSEGASEHRISELR